MAKTVNEGSLEFGDELGSGGQGRVLSVRGEWITGFRDNRRLMPFGLYPPGPKVYKQYKLPGADATVLTDLAGPRGRVDE